MGRSVQRNTARGKNELARQLEGIEGDITHEKKRAERLSRPARRVRKETNILCGRHSKTDQPRNHPFSASTSASNKPSNRSKHNEQQEQAQRGYGLREIHGEMPSSSGMRCASSEEPSSRPPSAPRPPS
jgi:hypothetical protein